MSERLTAYQIEKLSRVFERDAADADEIERLSPYMLKLFDEIRARRADDRSTEEKLADALEAAIKRLALAAKDQPDGTMKWSDIWTLAELSAAALRRPGN